MLQKKSGKFINKNKKILNFKSKVNKKNERIEILDFEESTKYERRRPKLKLRIKNKFEFSLVCLVIIAILLTGASFITGKNVVMVGAKKVLNGLGIYTEAVKEIEIASDDADSSVSWHVNKSAEWIGNNEARILFDVHSVLKRQENYKDVILVLDVSGSMTGNKLAKAKKDSTELIDYLLKDSNNRVAIVTFESSSTIISPFTNDKKMVLEKLKSIISNGGTNYNVALQNVDTVMDDYIKESNRDVVTLFLTDGYLNEESPSQEGVFELLKDKYSYMKINGIQYEMGSEVIHDIKQITDSQWVADQSNLNNVLFEAALNPTVYESFVITDYIHDDYFKINSVDDIKVDAGTVKLEEESGLQKIIWDLGANSFSSGGIAQMEIKVLLKDSYVNSEGFYPTNKKESITYKFMEEGSKTINSTDTPVLKNNYEVFYDVNAPEGCSLEPIEKEKHFVYDTIIKKDMDLSCTGYLFKGWEIEENDAKDIQRVNDNVFIMPKHDVTIRATWTKHAIEKTMDGTVRGNMTPLYKVLQKAAEEGVYAEEYTGVHQDSMNASESTQKIYHWSNKDVTNMANVLFAGHCWQMFRTTDTGGVKMIYNGEAEDGKCLNTRGNHVGYAARTSQNLTGNYWYGTDYTYDAVTNTFKISGTKEQSPWNNTTSSNLIGKYTCKMTVEDGSCSNLYLVESYQNATMAQVIPLNSNSHYSQFGSLQFNASRNSPIYGGYMYGDVYPYNTVIGTGTQNFTVNQAMIESTTLDNSHWYADAIEYDPTTKRYSLVNPYQVSGSSGYSDLVGKYTFRNPNQTNTGTSVYYIAGVNDSIMYYKQLQNGNLLDNYSIVFGESITDNGDGTYTINNPETVSLKDWYANYAMYKNKYTCNNSNSTCNNPRYITNTSSKNYTYLNAGDKILISKSRENLTLTDTILARKDELIKNPSNYIDYQYTCNTNSNVCTDSTLRMILGYTLTGYTYVANHYYGSSITWDGSKYTLVDPIGMENYNNLTNLSTHHYICTSYGEKECSTIGYVYSYTGSGNMYYITLKNGATEIDTVLENMLTKNTTNSLIKTGVDAWYKKYLINYSDYLEDAIFCNNRSIKSLGGWNPNGGSLKENLYFKESSGARDLSCTNITDRFSVSNEQAKLTYKVGLISGSELVLSSASGRKTSQWYWAMTPVEYANIGVNGRVVDAVGNMRYTDIVNANGVRPVISLKPGTEYSDGDGSMEHPYVVELE